jgi:hypothetical protein
MCHFSFPQKKSGKKENYRMTTYQDKFSISKLKFLKNFKKENLREIFTLINLNL